MTSMELALRWESTNDEWWYVTPIDYAAATGLSDLVMQMLSAEPNLLLKLTALPRIRRLESVWDDSDSHNMVAQARAKVARALLSSCECSEPDQKNNPLMRAGYSGWLLYTAASGGDVGFVNELLERNPSAVFGEGEYGITDILYGGARSKNSHVFRVLLEFANDWVKKSLNDDVNEGFLLEVMNRAVHCAARGGNLVILKELLLDCDDVLVYRDVLGCSVLHSASAKGQVEVVKHLITTYDIIHSTDNQGNSALHVAAYWGYFPVVEVLANASAGLITMKNNSGDTFLHMAVAGFLSPGFHRIDQQMKVMKQIVSNIDVKGIINVPNKKGKTALHIALAGNISLDVVDLLTRVPLIDLNVQDVDGLTIRDLLKQRHRKTSSDIVPDKPLASDMCISTSPGTSFRYSDADLFSCTGSDDNDSEVRCETPSTKFTRCSSDLNSRLFDSAGSFRSGSARFKFLFRWSRKEQNRKTDGKLNLHNMSRNTDDFPISMRQKYANKRDNPTSLHRGVSQGTPPYSPSCRFSSPSSPNSLNKLKSVKSFFSGPLRSQIMDKQHKRVSSFNKNLMNQYLCFGAQDLAVEDSVDSIGASRSCRRLVF